MIRRIKRNKLLFLMIMLTIISFIVGILFSVLISENNKKVIADNINLLINNKLILPKNIFINNILITTSIYLLGISVIGLIIILPIYFFKVFILSFEMISLITTLKLKNIIAIIIYLLPNIINVIIYFIICYYAINYSIYLIKNLFFNKKYNMYLITRKYLVIFLISLILIILSSSLEIFILPKLKLLIK